MTAHYERLSFLDNSFLALESRTTHMHVGAITLFEAGPLASDSGGIEIDRVRTYIGSRLHLIPRYRQRLAWVPVERHPVWVDDEHFALDYHVRHISLPRPGTDEQLKALTGRLMSQQLDRSKPLWELTVVEGLEDGRFALVSKIHHCMLDGISGVDLMAVLLSLQESQEISEPQPFEPRPAPNGTELVVRESTRRITEALAALKDLRTLLDDVSGFAGGVADRVKAMGASLTSGWLLPTGKTPINGDIGPNRRFEWLETPLADVKAVKNGLGGSVNDVVLATVAGGVRRYLIEHRGMTEAEIEDVDFRAMAPVSIRTKDQRGTLGNQVAMWLVMMPIADPDPRARLAAVRRETSHLKQTDQALGAHTLVRVSAGAPATLVSLGARLAANARPFNITVTNVPGPQFPLYLLGAQMVATYPLVPLWRSHGVGVALFSYDGTVFWGFNADYDLVADIDDFAAAMAASFAELSAAAGEAQPEPPVPRSAPRGDRTRPKSRPPLGTR